MVFVEGVKLCKFAHVQVQLCRPFMEKGRPFPTSFWLTCPYLVRLAGKIESSGGVHELEEYIISHNLVHEWRKYNIEHQVVRLRLNGSVMNKFFCRYRHRIYRDVMRGGTGGLFVGEAVSVKCLHLQTASFLGLGYHPAEEWLKAHGLSGGCGSACPSCLSCKSPAYRRQRKDSLPRKLRVLSGLTRSRYSPSVPALSGKPEESCFGLPSFLFGQRQSHCGAYPSGRASGDR